MIILNGTGAPPQFNMPSASPFSIKAETLLKMARIEYEKGTDFLDKAPKGKIPFIYDEDKNLGDSTFIRMHLEEKYGADFNGDYTSAELAIGWALEKMMEEHLYFIILYFRWVIDKNFDIGPRFFFMQIPEESRETIIGQIRSDVKNRIFLQGLGRHTHDEMNKLAKLDIDSVSNILGDKLFILGDEPCGYDASIHACLWAAACPLFEIELGEYVRNNPKLLAYLKRMNELYYPEYSLLK